MKKLMLALAALALMATAGFAATGVAVQWTTSWGIYDHAAVDLTSTETGGILDSYAITWQLIYSLDNVADAPDAGNGANGWVSNDDEVWPPAPSRRTTAPLPTAPNGICSCTTPAVIANTSTRRGLRATWATSSSACSKAPRL